MRTIKYRQPMLGAEGEFIGWHYWGFIDGRFIGPSSAWVNGPESQQFTGLHDRNGVEIYEKDRVKCIWSSDFSMREVIGTVEYIDGCFTVALDEPQFDKQLKTYRPNLYVKCFVINHAIEVIGNIFEHHELMKGGQK